MINAKLKVIGESVNGASDQMHLQEDSAEVADPALDRDLQRRIDDFFVKTPSSAESSAGTGAGTGAAAAAAAAAACSTETPTSVIDNTYLPVAKRLRPALDAVDDFEDEHDSDQDDVLLLGDTMYCPHCKASMALEALERHIHEVCWANSWQPQPGSTKGTHWRT